MRLPQHIGKGKDMKKKHRPVYDVMMQIDDQTPTTVRDTEESRTKAQYVSYLLKMIGDFMQWFADSEPESRDILRSAVDLDYLQRTAMLMTMMADKKRFENYLSGVHSQALQEIGQVFRRS